MSDPRDNGSGLAVGLLIGIILIQLAVLVLALKINGDNAEQQRSISYGLRQTQLENCLKPGNVLRDQIRDEFVDLKEDVLIPTFSKIAATIPPGAPARKTLRYQVAYMQHRIATIDNRIPNADCLGLYPPLPGQHYPPDLIRPAAEQAE